VSLPPDIIGSDVFRTATACRNALAALRTTSERLARHLELDPLLGETLSCLEGEFGIDHAMVLLYDEHGQRVFTVASLGYPSSGIGSEILLGEGVIGAAAQQRTPIRNSEMSAEYAGYRALRDNALASGQADVFMNEIPLPGLPESRSQLAVPMVVGEQLIGVLYVESQLDLRFSKDDEDALVALAVYLAMAIRITQPILDTGEETLASAAPEKAPGGEPLTVRHFRENDSIFLGEDYLIKGVAGSIFAVLVSDFTELGRTEFTNRELRLDPRVRLPAVSDNLEGRLILLERRLTERGAPVRIEKSGRGRFRLVSEQPLRLEAA
jgi:adenylate cyclase